MPAKRKAAAKPALERATRRLRTSLVPPALSPDKTLKSLGQVKAQRAVRGKISKAQANSAAETGSFPTAVEEQGVLVDAVDVAGQVKTGGPIEEEEAIGAEARLPPALVDPSKAGELEITAELKTRGRAKAGAIKVEAERRAGASSIVPSAMHDQGGSVGKLSDVLYTIDTLREQITNLSKQQEATKKRTVPGTMGHGIEVNSEAVHEIGSELKALAEFITMRLEACEDQLLEINGKQDTMGQLLSIIVQRLAPSLTSGMISEPGRNSVDGREIEQQHGLEAS